MNVKQLRPPPSLGPLLSILFPTAIFATLMISRFSARDNVTLKLEMVLDLPGGSTAAIFWAAPGEAFAGERRYALDVNPGYGAHEVALPVGIDTLIGFVSGQEFAEMAHYSDRLDPSLFVVLDGWNDVYVPFFSATSRADYGYNWSFLGDVESRLLRLALSERSPESDPNGDSHAIPRATQPEIEERLFQAYSENLKRMAAFAASRGAKLLVALQPHLASKRHLAPQEEQSWALWLRTYPDTPAHLVEPYDRFVRKALAFCGTRGIACVDLNAEPRFRDDPGELFLDTVHPNARGHRILAELIEERLSSLPEGPGSGP